MAAYKEALPANGFNKGFSSWAPAVVMTWRVDQASKVAAPLEAMTKPFHINSFRRFSARNSATDTVNGLPGFMNASGAGAIAAIGNGSSGRSALDSIAGSVAASKEAVTFSDESSTLTELAETMIAAGVRLAVFSADRVTVVESCG